ILIAGLMIIYEAIDHLIEPRQLQGLNYGIMITAAAGVVNFIAGTYAIREGRKHKSLTIEAAGRHIRVDAYSTFAIILGLGLLMITGWQWLDSAVALVFAVVIIVTGYRVVRKSLAGIMDEADVTLLAQVIT